VYTRSENAGHAYKHCSLLCSQSDVCLFTRAVLTLTSYRYCITHSAITSRCWFDEWETARLNPIYTPDGVISELAGSAACWRAIRPHCCLVNGCWALRALVRC